jgi:hypothetical protein
MAPTSWWRRQWTRGTVTRSWWRSTKRYRTQGCWGHAGQLPLLSMLTRATWRLYVRSPLQPIPVVLGGSPTGDSSQGVRWLCTGSRAKTVRYRRGLASSNIP